MSIRHLSMSDRSRIEVYLELGWSNSRIAKEIKFSKQTISREVRRNRNSQGWVLCPDGALTARSTRYLKSAGDSCVSLVISVIVLIMILPL